MAVNVLRRIAAEGAAEVFSAVGRDALAAVEDLALHPSIAMQASPRHASLLLVAGDGRTEDRTDLHRLHDQLPHPRATLWWRTAPDVAFGSAKHVLPDSDPAPQLIDSWRRLITGETESESDLLPNEPPAPWRGKGDHGQGGEGMMGGKPYGRPLAMTDDDLRDGLALDSYTACFGPFLAVFPPGLLLEVTLQGDVIQEAKVRRPPLFQSEEPKPAAALRSIARLLRLLGLSEHAGRFFRAAHRQTLGGEPDVRRLDRMLRWSGALKAIPPGLGAADGSDARDRVARWWVCATASDYSDTADGAPAPDSRLVDLLTGLDWFEACLVINSFSPSTLRRMCPVDRPSTGGDESEEHAGYRR